MSETPRTDEWAGPYIGCPRTEREGECVPVWVARDLERELAERTRDWLKAREDSEWWKRNCVAASEIETDLVVERDALRAEVECLRKDAARYRWLRHGDNDEQVICRGPVDMSHVYLLRAAKLDAAIDAALTPAEEPKT